MNGRTVTFRRVTQETPRQPRKRREAASQKPFKTIAEKPFRIRIPSKTRVAKALARAKNVERRMAAAPYKGKFKQRPAYEKRLFKPEAKPTSHE